MPANSAPIVLPHQTLAPQDAEVLLRLVHGPAGSTFKELEAPAVEKAEPAEAPATELPREQSKLLVGEYTVVLDSKSRFLVPSTFIHTLGAGEAFLTAGNDECLWLFSGPEFRRIYGELQDAVTLSPSAVVLKTFFTGHSYSVTPDGSNRITVPPPLRSFIVVPEPKAPSRLLLSGSGNFIEVWSLDKRTEHLRGTGTS